MKLFIVLEYNSLEGTRVELSIRDLCVKVQGDVRIIPASENRFMGIPQEKRRSKNEWMTISGELQDRAGPEGR